MNIGGFNLQVHAKPFAFLQLKVVVSNVEQDISKAEI
jgi:hypothetical protein